MASRVPTPSQVFLAYKRQTSSRLDGGGASPSSRQSLGGAVYRSESQGRELWQGRVLPEAAPWEPAADSPSSVSMGLV